VGCLFPDCLFRCGFFRRRLVDFFAFGFFAAFFATALRATIRFTDLRAEEPEPRSDLPRVSAQILLPLAHYLERTLASSSKEGVIRDDNPCLSASRCVSSVAQGAIHATPGYGRI
jgi:hypothetical protein